MGFDLGHILGDAVKLVGGASHGFNTAVATIQASGLNIPALNQARNALQGADQKAFDLATSIHNGIQSIAPPPGMNPTQLAGFYAMHGMVGNKQGVLDMINNHPDARAGALHYAQHCREPWWHWALRMVTFGMYGKHDEYRC